MTETGSIWFIRGGGTRERVNAHILLCYSVLVTALSLILAVEHILVSSLTHLPVQFFFFYLSESVIAIPFLTLCLNVVKI